MLVFAEGSPAHDFSKDELRAALCTALDKLGPREKVLALPPDFTRFHSQAGLLTEMTWEFYGPRLKAVLPATGTHVDMGEAEIGRMFGATPKSLFRTHDWRRGLVNLGEVPSEYVCEVSQGKVEFSIPAQVNELVANGGHDLILSIGQVVPHEVIGMANHNKNVFVGTGGLDSINRTHFLGAAYGMERIMGRADSPVRRVLNYASKQFARELPIIYVLTVIGTRDDGSLAIRGLFIGDDEECFRRASELSLKVNVEQLDAPLRKVIVYLDPSEFQSTWLGNKSIYRTRMAIADGGELVVLAPGVSRFGEDNGIDALIRKYGYAGTPKVLALVKSESDLQQNLSAAAHLIHGSSEGRFTITYCPGSLTGEEVESVGFRFSKLGPMMERYDPAKLRSGYNTMTDGEEIYFIGNPALGLWACRDRFTTQ